jgi:hypothetical protein
MSENEMEAAHLGAEKRLGEAQARRVLAEIHETVNGETLPPANWIPAS